MYRFEHRGESSFRIDVSRCSKTDSAADCSRDISQDVTKEIICHYNIKSLWVCYKEHRRSINVEIICCDIREFLSDCFKSARPEASSTGQNIVFMHQSELFTRTFLGAGKGISNDTLCPTTSIEALFGRNLISCSVSKDSTCTNIWTFCTFANDQKIDWRIRAKWARYSRIETSRSEIYVMIECKT